MATFAARNTTAEREGTRRRLRPSVLRHKVLRDGHRGPLAASPPGPRGACRPLDHIDAPDPAVRQAVVVSLQNGAGNVEALHAAVGCRVLGGTTTLGAFVDSDNALRVVSRGQTRVGLAPCAQDPHPPARTAPAAVARLLSDCGLPCEQVPTEGVLDVRSRLACVGRPPSAASPTRSASGPSSCSTPPSTRWPRASASGTAPCSRCDTSPRAGGTIGRWRWRWRGRRRWRGGGSFSPCPRQPAHQGTVKAVVRETLAVAHAAGRLRDWNEGRALVRGAGGGGDWWARDANAGGGARAVRGHAGERGVDALGRDQGQADGARGGGGWGATTCPSPAVPQEIESITGFVVREGRRHGVVTPLSESLRSAVLGATAGGAPSSGGGASL